METTEKKPNGGYSRLKVKYAKLKAEKEEIERRAKDSDETIRKQGSKISKLSADLSVAQGNEEEWKRKYNEAIAHVPALIKWWHKL